MECLAAIRAGQQQPKPAYATPANSSSQSTFMTDLGSNASVQLHATELVAELIANTYTSLGHEANLAALPGGLYTAFLKFRHGLFKKISFNAMGQDNVQNNWSFTATVHCAHRQGYIINKLRWCCRFQ